jgi:hypothetical protein
LHTTAVRGCGDASHLFLGCAKAFFAFFDVDGAVSLALTVSNMSSLGRYNVWACDACCCCALVGEKLILDHFSHVVVQTIDVQRALCRM